LSEHEILIAAVGCCGQRGANRDYAVNTHQSLQERGVHDARLARLVYQLRASGHA
jgi:cation transport regulator ChaC